MMHLAFLGSSIGAGEILLILLVALLLFGAPRLPSIARSLGQALEEFRRAARNLTRDFTTPPPPDTPANEADAEQHVGPDATLPPAGPEDAPAEENPIAEQSRELSG